MSEITILIKSIIKNQDCREQKLEKMNNRKNEIHTGDVNKVDEAELLMPPLLKQPSDDEVKRDSGK